MNHPLQDAFDKRQEGACETLDYIEEQAWDLCSSVRDLRIDLSRLDSLREKLDVM